MELGFERQSIGCALHELSPAIAGSGLAFYFLTWGLRPRLYSAARFAG
jgi:hypothetical protein